MRENAHRRSAASRLSAVGGTALKAAAWIVAVPALCIAVGAAPLYLLLPDDKPALAGLPAPAASAAKPQAAPADPSPVGSVSSAAGEAPAESEDAAATPAAPDAPPRPEAVAVVPTPRPEPPPVVAGPPAVPAPGGKPADREATRLASVGPVPASRENGPEAKTAAAPGQAVIVRTVTLRSGPRGREVGRLDQGTRVAVGRCEEWCEVRANGTRGWVHSSFLRGALPAKAGEADRTRSADRREAERRNREAREARAWARAEERRRFYDDGMDGAEPGWFVDDGPPVVMERRRPPPARFYEPEDYIPY